MTNELKLKICESRAARGPGRAARGPGRALYGTGRALRCIVCYFSDTIVLMWVLFL
jgi:hypothetical protein